MRALRPCLVLLPLVLSMLPIPSASTRAAAEPTTAPYVVGLLYRGARWTPERTARTESLQAGHMANMEVMWRDGLLVGAGPMLDGGMLRGVWFFRQESMQRIHSAIARDPAVASGRLRCELERWRGAPGIGDDYQRRAAAGAPDSMARYVFGLLLPGRRFTQADSVERKQVQHAHLANLDRMVEEGQLILAGPLGNAGDLRGIVVFSTPDTAVARRWSDTDPAVRAGRLRVELHPWMVGYGVIPGH